MNPFLNVIAAFVAGAAAVWYLGGGTTQRRMSAPHDDALLRERVQQRLAGLVSRPEDVELSVEDGVVRVSGRVPAREMEGLMLRLKDVPGVQMIYNALSTFDDSR